MSIFIKKFLYKWWPLIVFLFIFIAIFYKVFFLYLLPFPGDLLVSWFFPYKSGGWVGYSRWITHKEFIAADVVRQLYPWKTLVIDSIKNAQIPLWNPYAFSGTPLLANLQSAVFYPINILFLIFPYQIAWIIYILLQPVFACVFMYMFVRSLRLSRYAALFAGIAFGFMGYLSIWFEWGVIGHTALWLPLCLFGINKYLAKKQSISLFISSIALTLSFFAGHAQTAVYVLLTSCIYYIYMSLLHGITVKKIFFHVWFIALAFGLSAIQLIPSIELFFYSARNSKISDTIFYHFQLDWKNIVTLFAPDFYGNPASGNFWGRDYGEFIMYIGIVALVFTFIGVKEAGKNKIVKFFVFDAMLALLFALPTFLSNLLVLFKIPVLSSSAPSRSLFIFQFSLLVIASFGIEQVFTKNYLSKLPILLLACVYFGIWIIVFLPIGIIPDVIHASFVSTTRNNLYLPSVIFLATCLMIFLVSKKRVAHFFVFLGLLCLMAFEYQYFLYKYSPFAPLSYFFPNHSFLNYIQKTSFPERVFGYDTARLDTNLSTQWRILSPEGYDALYIRRYGELLYSSYSQNNGEVLRSDALFENSPANLDSNKKQRLMNLLGVQFVVAKDDTLKDTWVPNVSEFSKERYDLIMQQNVLQVYKNKKSLPRAEVFYNDIIVNKDSDIINTLFKKDFPYMSTIVLEENPPQFVKEKNHAIVPARISYYSPNKVDIDVNTSKNGMLFLSDTFYPGWKAYVDKKEVKIYRADYIFRAIFVRAGKHAVTFLYQPISFAIGAFISIVSLLISALTICIYFVRFRSKKYKKIIMKTS